MNEFRYAFGLTHHNESHHCRERNTATRNFAIEREKQNTQHFMRRPFLAPMKTNAFLRPHVREKFYAVTLNFMGWTS